MIREYEYPFRKAILDPPVRQLANLSTHTLVPRNVDMGCSPPLRHEEDEERHGFFGGGHVAVVRLAMEHIEGHPNILGDRDSGKQL